MSASLEGLVSFHTSVRKPRPPGFDRDMNETACPKMTMDFITNVFLVKCHCDCRKLTQSRMPLGQFHCKASLDDSKLVLQGKEKLFANDLEDYHTGLLLSFELMLTDVSLQCQTANPTLTDTHFSANSCSGWSCMHADATILK